MTSADHIWPVIVIGSGPTGSAAAILLAQQGVPVLVLDRWSDVYPQPRAVHLDDEVFRILARMQLAESFADISRPGLGLQLVDRTGRILGRVARLPEASCHGYPQANMYDQPELEQLLRQRMAALPEITFRGNVEVIDLNLDPDGKYRVIVQDRDSGETQCLNATYVLGADGANSIVRSKIGTSLEPLNFEQRWLVVDGEVDQELGHWEGVHQVCDDRRAGTYMRIGDTRHRWEFQLLPTETCDDFSSFEQLRPLLDPWIGTALPDAITIVRTAEYTFRAAVADQWREANVFLLGDAAHLTPPFIGQGLGSGLRDAENLAWKLARVLRGELDVSVLESYEQERKPHARALIHIARLMGVAMTGGGRAGSRVRRALLPPLTKVLSHVEFIGRGATPRLEPSHLVDYENDKLSGALAPNLVRGILLDAEIGGRWACLSSTAIAPSLSVEFSRLGCAVRELELGDEIQMWLAGAKVSAVLVRPDGYVMASGEPVDLASKLSALVFAP